MLAFRPVIVFITAAVATAAVAALFFSCAASAEPLDEAFLNDLESRGIYFDTPEWAVYQANYVCDEFDNGRSYTSLQQEGVAQSSLNSDEIPYFIQRAVWIYCPGNLTNLIPLG